MALSATENKQIASNIVAIYKYIMEEKKNDDDDKKDVTEVLIAQAKFFFKSNLPDQIMATLDEDLLDVITSSKINDLLAEKDLQCKKITKYPNQIWLAKDKPTVSGVFVKFEDIDVNCLKVMPKSDESKAKNKDLMRKSEISEDMLQVNGHKFYMPEYAEEIEDAVRLGENVWLYGPSGCGKTTTSQIISERIVRELNDDLGEDEEPLQYLECDFSQGVEESIFLGTKTATVDENGQSVIKFLYGILPLAMKKGVPLIVNEGDFAEPKYLSAMHGAMEGKLIMMENENEVITPTKGFCILWTANTVGRGDENGMYRGTKVFNNAFLDRFSAFFEFDYTDKEKDIITEILKDDQDPDVIENLMDFTRTFRSQCAEGDINAIFSTRRLVNVAKKIKIWGIRVAFRNVVLHGLTKDDQETTDEIFSRIFGHSLMV